MLVIPFSAYCICTYSQIKVLVHILDSLLTDANISSDLACLTCLR